MNCETLKILIEITFVLCAFSDESHSVETDFWESLLKMDQSTSHKKKFAFRFGHTNEGTALNHYFESNLTALLEITWY